VERLSSRGQTLRTDSASVISRRHGHVAGIARHFDLVILNNVLLKDSVTSLRKLRLVLGKRIEISFRQETVVTGDVVRNFRSTDRQLIVHVLHLLMLVVQSISGVVTVGSKGAAVLSLEE